MHVIGAKAVAFGEALDPRFKTYAEKVIKNAKALADQLQSGGLTVISGGTDNHMMLLDLRPFQITGDVAERVLERSGVTANKNMIPGDPQPPRVTSGIRLGSPALTTRGFSEDDFRRVGDWILKVLKAPQDESLHSKTRSEIREFCKGFPLWTW